MVYIVTTMFVCYSKQFGMLKLDDILQKIHIFAKVNKSSSEFNVKREEIFLILC